ncbi:helix-turn-helix transcriptional regulator [Pantoea sp.]|uniref:AraC family transcriptional regulator n=1 Tax=Pantoea sp. TaxID=69393 RepID=UPI0028B13969|nr:helix-turn-helix transcriptional regulator [Pantoea sp.]
MEETWHYFSQGQYQQQSRPVIANTYEYRNGDRQAWHSHEQLQFIFTTRGVLSVITSQGSWTLGPNRGLLLLPRTGHELYASGEALMHSIYIEPDVWRHERKECCVLLVSSLLRELVLEMVKERRQETYILSEMIVPLLLRGLHEAQELQQGCLPLPEDRRLQKICKALMLTPSNNESLEIWGDRIGTSDRTLSRLFIKQTGYTFGQWRQQLRLVESMTRLAQGMSVATIATELGYRSSSSFITMFRKAMGETPQNYFKKG